MLAACTDRRISPYNEPTLYPCSATRADAGALEIHGTAHNVNPSEMLNISEATMHHDLDWLKTHGFLEHVHNRWAIPTRQGAWEFTRCL